VSWQAILGEAFQRIAPQQIVALDSAALQVAEILLPDACVQLSAADTPLEAPAHVALVIDALNDLDAAQARTLLAHVRNFIAPRIFVVATARCALDRLAFLAIGYDVLGVDEIDNSVIYHFDLNTYKQVPDWLNARHWAHPERWKP
jgi:hypothetical protein